MVKMPGINAQFINILPFDVKERLKKGEKLNIVDVRENEEVVTGKIPGAKHIRLGDLQERYKEIDPNAETIIVCRSSNRSGVASEFLVNMGYRNVKNMVGGMSAWDGDIE